MELLCNREIEAPDCVLSKLSLQPKFSAFEMDGFASFHDSASGGFPDYCYRKYLRPIRRVYLGAYKKGAFLDQYDSVQNGIKTNYVTFKKLLEVLPLIVLRFFHQSCCASPLNCGAVSLLSCCQQPYSSFFISFILRL